MNTRKRPERRTSRRILGIFCIFAFLACLLTVRLAYLQLIRYNDYESIVLDQLTIDEPVNPERGIITDRNGNILAANITVYDVVLSPADIIDQVEEDKDILQKRLEDEDPENNILYEYSDPEYDIYYTGNQRNELIAEVLSGYLQVDYAEVLDKAARVGFDGELYYDDYYEVVKKSVDADMEEKLETFVAKFGLKREVYFQESAKRYYPKSDLAAHVIGFTNSEGVGVYGLEAYYNNLLEGTSGRYLLAQDAKHQDMPFEYERYIEAENGYNIVTTLDIYIQYELENQLKKTFIESGAGNRVTGIVMDVNTGGILAMATYPPFDLNDPYTIDEYSRAELEAMGLAEGTAEYKEKYTELMYRMWNNKAITETYEPGSTFKIITTAMAFEEGVVTPETPFYCSGSLMVEGWGKPISCHLHSGHGAVSFRVGLQQSCNPTLMQIAAGVGRQKFYDYFQSFGYTAKTGVDLPGEVNGIYSAYKNFSGVSLAVYSFGQTFKTTALQQLRAISTVANGGYLITPHLLKEIVDDDGNVIQSYETEEIRQVVSTDVCETITEILEEGVAGDGGAKNAYVKGYRVAAKTGTSEKRDEYDENGNTPFRVGSTAAYAPADDPQVSAIIIVDKPLKSAVYGSVVAAPYISSLMGYVLPYIGVEAQYTTEELAALDVTLSNYVGATVEAARTDLEWRGFEYEFVGNGGTVTAQIPEAGSKISSDTGRLILYTGAETPAQNIVVPDLTGMTAYNANNAVVNAGLNVIFTGSTNGSTAVVVNQAPAAGTRVTRGTIVEIVLRHMDGTD